MARKAQSTIPATVIFVTRGNRRNESERGLASLDVSPGGQIYLGLPDGELWQHQAEIAETIVSVVIRHNIGHVMTLGANGYDHHPDHIASHFAAANAVRTLRTHYDRNLNLLTLNNRHCGSEAVKSTTYLRQRKLGALASHQSQFPLSPLNGGFATEHSVVVEGFVIDPDFWNSFAHYQPLILRGETYDVA